MKSRRRNPQTGNPPKKNPVRNLFRGALVDILENDFKASRHHRSRPLGPSKTWPLGQEPLAASSLDKYVKAVLHDERLDKKDPLSACGSPKPSRSQTPDPLDFEALCQKKSSAFPSPLSKSRNKERWASVIQEGPWTRHGSDRNHHQPSDFQIRGKEGGWKPVKVVLDPSLTHSLISEDTVLVEPRWPADVQMRTSSNTSPVPITMASTTLLPGDSDVMVGQGLFKKLLNMSSSSTSPELDTSIKDAAVSTSDDADDDDNLSQGRLNHDQHSTPQPDDKGSTWSELCDSELDLSSEFMDFENESRTWCELLGGAYEAV